MQKKVIWSFTVTFGDKPRASRVAGDTAPGTKAPGVGVGYDFRV